MFDLKECETIYLEKIGKSYDELSSDESVMLVNILLDNSRGRYPKLLMWPLSKHEQFVRDLAKRGIDYFCLNDIERYAYEDAYDM